MSKRVRWEARANILADALLYVIERGCAMHYDDETTLNEPATCVGCRADDVLAVMGRYPDLSARSVKAYGERKCARCDGSGWMDAGHLGTNPCSCPAGERHMQDIRDSVRPILRGGKP